MSTLSHGRGSETGLIGALRRLRDPLLLLLLPITFAVLLAFLGYGTSWPIGFDFRGTLWEPARALLDGEAIYPDPTRDNVVVGNPTVYPPAFILALVPLALLPVTLASWLWLVVLGAGIVCAMWVVGLRDWRCHVLAVTSPVVVHGLWFGNLTLGLVLFVALAWRYRDDAPRAGLALGAAIAAKLFVAPLVVWLLLTRRFRAAAWTTATAVALVIGAWAVVGFEGFRDYPALLRVVQDVYAVRSVSLSTVAGALGASATVAVAVAAGAGLVLLALAALMIGKADGDRRAFAIVVVACVVASPIVWPNYAALLFVPIAVTWPRLAPAWFFGYAIWLAGAAPKPVTEDVCCRPPGVTEQAWLASHAEPALWFPAASTAVLVALAVAMVIARRELPSMTVTTAAVA